MNGPEHYAEAERLVEMYRASSTETDVGWVHTFGPGVLASAQVHATLALVAVTAECIFDPQGRPLVTSSAAITGWESVL